MLFVFFPNVIFRERINLRDGAKVELFGLLNFEEKHLKKNQKLNAKVIPNLAPLISSRGIILRCHQENYNFMLSKPGGILVEPVVMC